MNSREPPSSEPVIERGETRIAVDAVRARIAAPRVPNFWRSLDELKDTSAFGEYLAQHFPRYAEHYAADRRRFLKLMSASLALAGLAGCTREPQEKILPYVEAPVGQVA